MVIPALFSAWRQASIGPRPMISGLRPLTPLLTTRARGVRPSALALASTARVAEGAMAPTRRDTREVGEVTLLFYRRSRWVPEPY